MASATGNVQNEVQLDPKLAPRPPSREKMPVIDPPREKSPDNRSAVRGKKRRHKSSKRPKHSKASKRKRSKFSRTFSSSGDESVSSSCSSSSSDSEPSEASSKGASLSYQTDGNDGTAISISKPIVDFAAEAAFQGLSKSVRKNMLKDSPVPFHNDLRPKKVDSFVKKYLKRKGINFNPAMDRRQLNLAGRMLDSIGPLSQLWETARTAEAEGTGLDPALVVEFVRRAMSLIGNASYCALVDRRKGLLAKVSPDCLDLIEDPELFTPGSSDLFGKKFKKAVLKELKLAKEMDSLVSGSGGRNHGNVNRYKPFRQQPGKGPGFNTRPWGVQRHWNGSRMQSQFRGGVSQRRGRKPSFFPNQGNQN